MKRSIFAGLLILALSIPVIADEITDLKRSLLRERLSRIQSNFALGQAIMDKSKLEFQVTEAELASLESKSTGTQ